MKKQLFQSLFALLISCTGAIAQSFPYGINYQAVARDANGNAQINQPINIRFSINKTTATGTLIWQETNATATTNSLGQFNLVIGSGTSTGGGSAVSFSAIDWSADVHWLSVDIFSGTVYVPIASQKFLSVPYALYTKAKPPTLQKFTSGSGTYTTPAGVSYIEVEMIGGGGAGGENGSGSASSSPQNGTASVFGTSLLTANGGGGAGVPNKGDWGYGGTATLNIPAIGIAFPGADGSGGAGGGAGSAVYIQGGTGGSSPFGGAGAGAKGNNAGLNAVTNTGSGGGGEAGTSVGGSSGAGGGAGGYIKAIISSPATSYSYSVGSGGTPLAGCGAGGSGIIIIKEYY